MWYQCTERRMWVKNHPTERAFSLQLPVNFWKPWQPEISPRTSRSQSKMGISTVLLMTLQIGFLFIREAAWFYGFVNNENITYSRCWQVKQQASCFPSLFFLLWIAEPDVPTCRVYYSIAWHCRDRFNDQLWVTPSITSSFSWWISAVKSTYRCQNVFAAQ